MHACGTLCVRGARVVRVRVGLSTRMRSHECGAMSVRGVSLRMYTGWCRELCALMDVFACFFC